MNSRSGAGRRRAFPGRELDAVTVPQPLERRSRGEHGWGEARAPSEGGVLEAGFGAQHATCAARLLELGEQLAEAPGVRKERLAALGEGR